MVTALRRNGASRAQRDRGPGGGRPRSAVRTPLLQGRGGWRLGGALEHGGEPRDFVWIVAFLLPLAAVLVTPGIGIACIGGTGIGVPGIGILGFRAVGAEAPAVEVADSPSRDPESSGESRWDLERIEGDSPISDSEIRRTWIEAGSIPGAGLEALGRRLVEEGFLEARLVLRHDDPAMPAAVLTIEAGAVPVWDSLSVRVRGGAEPRAVPPQGEFDRDEFESRVWEWAESWAEAGHPFVIIEVEALTVEDGRLRAGLRVDPGPRTTVEEVAFPGRGPTKIEFLHRWIRYQAGETFRNSDLARRQRRLERSGLFQRVEEPRLEPLGPAEVRIHYGVRERPHNRIEGALGYSGEREEISGHLDLALGNLFGTGRKFAFRWERLEAERSRLDLAYEEPILFRLPVGAKLEVHQQVEDSTFTLDRFEGGLFGDLGTDLRVSIGLEYRRSVLGAEPSDVVRRVSTVFGAAWETLRPGRLVGSRAEASFRTGRSRIQPADGPDRRERLDRVTANYERYWRFGPTLVLRTEARGGGLSGGVARDLPLSEALWIGGLRGPRGFGEESLATRRFVLGQLETGVALAGDQGRAYAFVDGASYLALGAGGERREDGGWGVGISNETTNRSVSVDYGIPFGGSLGSGRVHMRLRTSF